MTSTPAMAAVTQSPRPSEAAATAQAGVRAFSLNRRPLVSLCFDDASQSVYDIAFPMLSARGIPATYFFLSSRLNDQWKAQLKDLEKAGWEISSHSKTHPDLTLLSNADLIAEVSQSKADLEGAGLKITGFAYPYGIGGDNAAVIRQVKQHYSYARSVDPGNNAPIIQQYALKTETPTSSTRIDAMKNWVDLAVANKEWVIILFHTIDDTGDIYSVSPANLLELTNYIKAKVDAGVLGTVTVQGGVTRYSQTDWRPIGDPQASSQSDLLMTNGQILWYLGSKVADYLHDGYEWVQNGELRYYELNGAYQTIYVPSHIELQSDGPDRATAEITLNSADGKASVISTVTLSSGSPLAEIHTIGAKGTPQQLSLAKDLARRYSIDDGLLVTDGLFEIGMRTYGDNARSFFAFDGTTDLIGIMTHPQRKSHSEYADYAKGEFRAGPISVASELPYTWFAGGIVFDTSSLLAEAESGTPDGKISFYTGTDASPKTGNTGVILDDRHAVNIRFTPPAQGNYTLAIRHKAASAGSQYAVQIDGGAVFTRTAISTGFGYENTALPDLSTQSHIVRVSAVSGAVDLDYVLLVPTSRSTKTPTTIKFPADLEK